MNMRKATTKKRIRTNFSLSNKVTIRRERIIFTAKSFDDYSKSPSKTTEGRLSFWTKCIAFTVAMASTSTTDWDRRICSDMDARTNPWQSWVTTLTPTVPNSLNTALSKLTLIQGGASLHHRTWLRWIAEGEDATCYVQNKWSFCYKF